MALYVYFLVVLELDADDLESSNQVYIFFGAALLMLPYIYFDMAGAGTSSIISTPGSQLIADLIWFTTNPTAADTFKIVALPTCCPVEKMNSNDPESVALMKTIEARPHVQVVAERNSRDAAWGRLYVPSVGQLRVCLVMEIFVNFPLFFLLTLPLVLSQSESSLELVLNMTAITFITKIDDRVDSASNEILSVYAVHKGQYAKEQAHRASAGEVTDGFGFSTDQ